MEAYFQIEQDGCSIGCKQICNPDAAIDRVVLFDHGFGGHPHHREAFGRTDQVVLKPAG